MEDDGLTPSLRNSALPTEAILPLSQNKVRVVNARGETLNRTSEKRAIRMIARGIAVPYGNGIKMLEGDRRVSPKGCVRRKERFAGYGIGFATLGCVEGLPVAGPAIRLFMGHRPSAPPRDYGEPIELSRKLIPESIGL